MQSPLPSFPPSLRTAALLVLVCGACEPKLGAEPAVAASAANDQPPLPAGWSGSGVLVSRDSVPRGAPDWGKVQTEVVEHDGRRFLRVSGLATDVATVALGRTTAENRARAEISRWLGSRSVSGAMVINTWQQVSDRTYLSQVEVALAPNALLGPSGPATK